MKRVWEIIAETNMCAENQKILYVSAKTPKLAIKKAEKLLNEDVTIFHWRIDHVIPLPGNTN